MACVIMSTAQSRTKNFFDLDVQFECACAVQASHIMRMCSTSEADPQY